VAPRRVHSSILLATIILIAAVSLTSCIPPPADETTPPTPTETATTAPTETTSPPPSEKPVTTCANVLSDAAYAELAASGATEQDPGPVSSLPDAFHGRSTLQCAWGPPNSDLGFAYAQTALTSDEWAEQEPALQADGFSPEDDPRGELLVGAPNDLGYIPAVLYSDGVLHYSSDVLAFDKVEALQ
jgi:hypothetical protein